jgi:SAM-dependent methyltransferase
MANMEQVRWDARYREQMTRHRDPLPFLVALDDILPRRGKAIDVAGRAGANAVWLAHRGLEATVSDISPVGFRLATDAAGTVGVRLSTLEIDLEHEPFPAGPWELTLCVRFLWRPLFEVIPARLAPGGFLVVDHPTRSNLLRHERPGLLHLLDDGELPGLVRGLEVLSYSEGWTDEGYHERADATAFLVTAAADLATNAVAAVAVGWLLHAAGNLLEKSARCRGSWPGFESEPSSLERLIPDHPLTGSREPA